LELSLAFKVFRFLYPADVINRHTSLHYPLSQKDRAEVYKAPDAGNRFFPPPVCYDTFPRPDLSLLSRPLAAYSCR